MSRKKGKQSRRGSAPNSMTAAKQELAEIIRRSTGEGYPPPEERQKIIDRRFQLMSSMLKEMVKSMGSDEPSDPLSFIEKHNQRDVIMVLNYIQPKDDQPSSLVDETFIYRKYRRSFAYWGGSRPFLNRSNYDKLNMEYLSQVARREMALIHFGPGKREKELRDLLITGSELWEDVVPREAPPRPADFVSPRPDDYPSALSPLLTWGPDATGKQTGPVIAAIRQSNLPAAADLLRMALDEGLLAGWPGEPAAWASENALKVMRALVEKHLIKPGEELAQFVNLAAMADRPDDWLSDELPQIWSALGPAIETPLKLAFASPENGLKRRVVLLEGLMQLTKAHPRVREGVLNQLVGVLNASSKDDAELNGDIIEALVDLDASETREAVQAAFDANKVDVKIISADEIDWL